MTNKKILVTGAFGQIGTELVPALQEKYGKEHVIAVGHNRIPEDFDGIVEKASLPDKEALTLLIEKYQPGVVFHMVSLLSASGEKDPSYTWDLNTRSLKDVLDLAVEKKFKVFWPSSIAAFGPTTPQDSTPQRTILEPTTMYGVTKVAGELLGQYYFLKYGVDIRSIRYPGIISWKQEPSGGTTDYAVGIFYDGITHGHYDCFVNEKTTLPMMYMDDAVKATIQLMEADPKRLTVRTSYNLGAMSFSAEELAKEIQNHIPLTVAYKPDHRQNIADSWPNSVDDNQARTDWDWRPEIDLPKMTEIMLRELRKKLA